MSLTTQEERNLQNENEKNLKDNPIFQYVDEILKKGNGYVFFRGVTEEGALMFKVRNIGNSHQEVVDRVKNGEKAEDVIKDYTLKCGFKTFSYNGSKSKFIIPVSNALRTILSYDEDKKIDTVISTNGGSMAGIISIGDILKEHGVKHFIFNDLNKTIVGFFKNCKDNLEELQKEVINLVISFHKHFKTIIVEQAEHRLFNQYLKDKLNEYELAGRHNDVKASAIFYFITRDSFNGLYEYDIDKHITKRVSIAPDDLNRFYVFLKNNDELKSINNFLHSFETVSFFTMDCIELIEEFRDYDNILFDVDPVYIDSNKTELVTGKANYGFEKENFNHLYLLELLQGTNYIYFNNAHTKLANFVEDNDCSIKKIYKTSNTDKQELGEKKSFTIEFLIYGSTNPSFVTEYSVEKHA